MNYELILRNVRASWRNLMKYKTQNIIAVLCLSVGLVLFSATFIIMQRAWQRWKRSDGDSRRAEVSLPSETERYHQAFAPEDIRRIYNANLSSIDFIDFDYYSLGTVAPYTDLKGKVHEVDTRWKWISPEHLNYLKLKSAVTGKRIPILRPGDLVMTLGMLERTFGKGVNPIGFKVGKCPEFNGRKYETIVDVVDTGDWMLSEDHLLVITDQMQEFLTSDNFLPQYTLSVILAKGKTEDDLQAELQKLLPDKKVCVRTRHSFLEARFFVYALLVGGSILLIGLFGFLKTEIQLFRLRQREIGLRQCMGAKRSQLFGMLMWEVAIVFVFVTLLALVLTFCLADYALPILQKEMSLLTVDMSRCYATELGICLATFLLTAGIAALSVRKVILTPLSEVVGKSRRVSTRGRSLLVVLMMVICQLLLFVDAGVFTFADVISVMRPPANADAFRRCIVTDNREWKPEFLDTLQHLKHIEGTIHLVTASFGASAERNFEAILTDMKLFDMLDIEVVPPDTTKEMDSIVMIPVHDYRRTKRHEEAGLVGYIDRRQLARLTPRYYTPLAVYLCETSFFLDKNDINERVWADFDHAIRGYAVKHNVILKAKTGEYKQAERELAGLYREQGRYTLARAPIDNLYNVCFQQLRMLDLVLQLMFIMTVVAILCIVLTLYSSASLDTRGRQKEVAIRKAHGADTRQILWLFAGPYVWQLIVSSLITLLICTPFVYAITKPHFDYETAKEFIVPYLTSILAVALVTLLTVGYKIYRVSQLNPATIIKKE